MGEFLEVQPESSEEQARRQVREAYFAAIHSVNPQMFPEIKDHGKVVNGQTETSRLLIYDYAGGLISPLPARTSAAVIVGTVVSGKALLTKDHTFVYSNYQIQIDQILKPDDNLVVGGQLTAFRQGGTLHFPSGHVTNYIDLGEGYPVVGAQYLFFLGKPGNWNISEYQMTLFSVYELRNGVVYPIDDANIGQFEGISETALIDRTKQLIAASKNGGLQQ